MKTLTELLTLLKANDVVLKVDAGKIKFQDPNKVLQGDVLTALKHHKASLIELLDDDGKATALTVGAVDRSAPLPLSNVQRQMLFSESLVQDQALYNLPLAFVLRGEVDGERLHQALKTVIDRHESLRLGFSQDNGEWQARLNDVATIDIAHQVVAVDIDTVSADLYEQAQQTFVFDGSPLIRLYTRHNSKTGWYLVMVVMHHSVVDGISTEIFLADLNAAYAALGRGEAVAEDTTAPQFLDYVHWLRQQSFDSHKHYWQDTLGDSPTVLNAAHDFVRPVVMSFAGHTLDYSLPEELAQRIKQFSQAQGSTVFATMLAAFSLLLHRYSGQDDLLVGVPFANRELPETANMIGCFINSLPVRSQYAPTQSFSGFCAQAAVALQGASRHQALPLADIIELINPERSASHSPLFQVMINFVEVAEEAGAQSTVTPLGTLPHCEQLANPHSVAKYDLSFHVVVQGDELKVMVEYSTQLYRQASIERMFAHYCQFLSQAVAAADAPIGHINLMTADERALFQRINNTQLAYDKQENLVTRLYRHAQQKPNACALVFGQRRLSFSELTTLIDHVAAALREAGIYNEAPATATSTPRVGLYLTRGVELVVAIYALWKVGAAYVPLDPAYPVKRLKHVCQSAGLACVLTQSPLLPFVPEFSDQSMTDIPGLCIDELCHPDAASNAAPGDELNSVAGDPQRLAYVIFTSGTTGEPKGVMLTHGNVLNLMASLDARFAAENSFQGAQCWLAQTSISFDISVLELVWSLTRGHQVVMQQSRLPAHLMTQVSAPRSSTSQPADGQANNDASQEPLHLSERPLDFSLMFFAADVDTPGVNKYQLLLESAKFADQHGLSAVWMPERHFNQFGGAYPNPSVSAAAVAAITTRLGLRSGSVVLPLHDPIRVAEEWSMVDNLSNGRVGLALASGWHHNDFVFKGCDFANRYQNLRDGMRELTTLWRGDSIERQSGIDKTIDVRIKPTPVQAELPLWVTAAGSPDTFRYAGEIGAGILTHFLGQSIHGLKENIRIYHQALIDHGHSLDRAKVALMLHTYLDANEQQALAEVKAPFKAYLSSSLQLLKPLAEEYGIDIEGDTETVLEFGYNKFKQDNALFGSPDSCQNLLQNLHSIGVTEIASLIDFGVAQEKVLNSLQALVKARDKHHKLQHLAQAFIGHEYQSELELIKQHPITHAQFTPSQMAMVVDEMAAEGVEDVAVRAWLLGGEALPQELLTRLDEYSQSPVFNMYGPTETTVWSAISHLDVRIGTPIGNTRFVVADQHGSLQAPGLAGELLIAGDGVAAGYWGMPDLSAERFIDADQAWGVAGPFYRTGDLVCMQDDGLLSFMGRLDKQVKIGGHRIELKEIESTLMQAPGVKDASAQIEKTSRGDAKLYAFALADRPNGDQLPLVKYHFPNGLEVFDISDRHIGTLYHEVFERDIYLQEGITLPDGACIFDVGSNIGSFSILARHRCADPTIYAFEPIPDTHRVLANNFALHQIRGQVFNLGISSQPEQVTFAYYPNMPGLSGRFADQNEEMFAAESMIRDAMNQDADIEIDLADEQLQAFIQDTYQSREVDCQLTTISAVIDSEGIQQIDLLKIDIEKSECLALQGIREEHWPLIQQISMEVDGDDNLSFVREYLRERDFNISVCDFVRVSADIDSEQPHQAFNVYMLYARRSITAAPLPATASAKVPTPPAEAEVPTVASLRQYLSDCLPHYMLPQELFVVTSFPRLPNGKLDHNALLDTAREQANAQVLQNPDTALEKAICALWQEILKCDQVGLNSNFFEIGGTSFDLARLHMAMKKQFSVNFSIIELFRYVTVSAQVALIEQCQQQAGDHLDADSVGTAGQQALDRGAQRRQRLTSRRKTA